MDADAMGAEPDVFSMAESGLLAAVFGEWEITRGGDRHSTGRAAVKSLKDALLLDDTSVACIFSFRQRLRPLGRPVTYACSSIVTVHWGEGFQCYATLEECGTDSLTWRLPVAPDGTPGGYTVWTRQRGNATKSDTVAAVADARAMVQKSYELAESQRARAIEFEVACKEAEELADEIAEENKLLQQRLSAQDHSAESLEIAADENLSLRRQLDAQIESSVPSYQLAHLQEQLQALRQEMTAKEENGCHVCGAEVRNTNVRARSRSEDKVSPKERKKRRTVAKAGSKGESLGRSVAACGA